MSEKLTHEQVRQMLADDIKSKGGPEKWVNKTNLATVEYASKLADTQYKMPLCILFVEYLGLEVLEDGTYTPTRTPPKRKGRKSKKV